MLKEYAKKRRFGVTPEPKPETKRQVGALTFVVQKHAASHLHYDFRLELDGVLLSWAVPKGPSANTHDKRLAVHVEDHPLAYGGFEGTIPQGEYGGGEVIVWDRGTYHTDKAPLDREKQEFELRRQMERGKLEIVLDGEKLHGGYVLLHTKDKQWLLMKRSDEFASETDLLAEDRSVLTGHRIGGVADTKHAAPTPDIKPMLLTEAKKPFSDNDWSFELKLDGIRLIAFLDGTKARLVTRNGNEVSARFPSIAHELAALGQNEVVIDGEVVTFDESGRPNFHALVQPFQAGHVENADFVAFDLLMAEGTDFRGKPWKERRAMLEALGLSGRHIRLIDVFPEDGELLFEKATEMGFEGIVGKKIDSKYESGVRSSSWVKIKGYHSEEFVVGGYTKGAGARAKSFGALVLGRATDQGLEFVGKAGGGFDDDALEEVLGKLEPLRTDRSPFNENVPIRSVTWVRPSLVAEVRFMGWTPDKHLRFPIFMRMRPDLPPANQPSVQFGDLSMTDFKEAHGDKKIAIQGQEIHFTHLEKELWPGVTKGDLLDYYQSVGETLLRYLKNRPLSFVRCPDGVKGERFFQKHWDKGRPDFVETVSVFSDANEGPRDFVMCNNLPTLLWLGQMGTVELNPWNSRIDPEPGTPKADGQFAKSHESLEESVLNRPDYLVLDLDPHFGGKATGWKKPEWLQLVEAAYVLRDLLKEAGLECFPKSSGKSGLHLYLPVAREYTYDQIRAAARAIGERAIQRIGKKITLEWNVKTRPDGVFIDVNQNVRGKTMAAPYSPRASSVPSVSMPLIWEELERIDPTQFTFQAAIERLGAKGDLWNETVGKEQHIA